MAIFKKFLPHLDDFKLAAFRRHVVHFLRSALHARFVSDVYFDGARRRAKLADKGAVRRLVDFIFISFYNAVRSRLVGVLISNFKFTKFS